MFIRTMASVGLTLVACNAALVGAWIEPAQAAPQHYRCVTKQFSGDEARRFTISETRISIELHPDTRRWYVDPGLMGGNRYPETDDELVDLYDHVVEMLTSDDETFSKVRIHAIWNQRKLEFDVTYSGEDGAELAARRWRCTSLFEPRN